MSHLIHLCTIAIFSIRNSWCMWRALRVKLYTLRHRVLFSALAHIFFSFSRVFLCIFKYYLIIKVNYCFDGISLFLYSLWQRKFQQIHPFVVIASLGVGTYPYILLYHACPQAVHPSYPRGWKRDGVGEEGVSNPFRTPHPLIARNTPSPPPEYILPVDHPTLPICEQPRDRDTV